MNEPNGYRCLFSFLGKILSFLDSVKPGKLGLNRFSIDMAAITIVIK